MYFPYGRRKEPKQRHRVVDHHGCFGGSGDLLVQEVASPSRKHATVPAVSKTRATPDLHRWAVLSCLENTVPK
jgi:hypothetical protein